MIVEVGSNVSAVVGPFFSAVTKRAGCAGSVLHGYSRDTRGLLQLGLATFSFGGYAQDQRARGRVVDYRVPIEVAGVQVRPGDLVFGDLDGVVIVPRTAERETITQALEKVRKEEAVRGALEAGMPSAEAFQIFGVM